MSRLYTWQKQAGIFVVAMVVAVYQVNKSSQLLSQQEAAGEAQLRRAMTRAAAMCRDCVLFKSEVWRPSYDEPTAGAKPVPVQTALIVQMPGSAAAWQDGMPRVRGELFIDPLQRRKSGESGKKRRRRHAAQGQGRERSDPLLGFKLHDPSLESLANDLENLGLVARVLRSASATAAQDTRQSSDKAAARPQRNPGNAQHRLVEEKIANLGAHGKPDRSKIATGHLSSREAHKHLVNRAVAQSVAAFASAKGGGGARAAGEPEEPPAEGPAAPGGEELKTCVPQGGEEPPEALLEHGLANTMD